MPNKENANEIIEYKIINSISISNKTNKNK